MTDQPDVWVDLGQKMASLLRKPWIGMEVINQLGA